MGRLINQENNCQLQPYIGFVELSCISLLVIRLYYCTVVDGPIGNTAIYWISNASVIYLIYVVLDMSVIVSDSNLCPYLYCPVSRSHYCSFHLLQYKQCSQRSSISFNEGILIERAVKPMKAVGGLAHPWKIVTLNNLRKVPQYEISQYGLIPFCLKCQLNQELTLFLAQTDYQ